MYILSFLMDDALASKLTVEKCKIINFQITACMCTAAHWIWCTFERERWYAVALKFSFQYTTSIRTE